MVDEWTNYGVYIMNERTGKLQCYYITKEALGLVKTLKSMTKGDYRKVLPCDGPQLVNRVRLNIASHGVHVSKKSHLQ